MKVTVIGGTGLIGSKLVKKLRDNGQEVVAASPASGVNALTGEGLANALKGASVVVDVTNSPSWEDAAVLKFFETSTRNLLDYEAAEGVRHHVALSVVGTERLLESGFFRAKLVQENLIKASSIPYSIVRATQFFEFVKKVADLSTEGNKVRLPPVLFQPMAADDVASALAGIAMRSPVNGTVEIGGPDSFVWMNSSGGTWRRAGSPRGHLRPARALLRHPGEREVAGPGRRRATRRGALRGLAHSRCETSSKDRSAAGVGAAKANDYENITTGWVLTFLFAGTLIAQDAEVTPLMSKDLTDFPGKEGVMITVVYPPGASDPIHRHNAHAFVYVLEGTL